MISDAPAHDASFLDQESLREKFEGKFKSAQVGFASAYFWYGSEKVIYTTHAIGIKADAFIKGNPGDWHEIIFKHWLENHKPQGNTFEGVEPLVTEVGAHLVWRKTPQIIYQQHEDGERHMVFFCRFAVVADPLKIKKPQTA